MMGLISIDEVSDVSSRMGVNAVKEVDVCEESLF